MRVILNNVPITTTEGDSVTITTSMSDPVPTCTLNVRDDTSSLSIQRMQELLIIDDQQIPNPTNNILVNPSLNPYTSNWGTNAVTGVTYSQVVGGGVNVICSNVVPSGSVVVFSGGNTLNAANLQSFYTPGQMYMGSCYVQGTSPVNLGAYIQINWYDAAGNIIALSSMTGPPLVSTSITRYTVSGVCPPGGARAVLALAIIVSSGTNSGTVTFTQAQIEPMWFPNTVSYPTPWCGPNQANCKQIPGSTTWIRQYRKFAGYVNHAIAQNYHGNARQWQINAVGYAWLCGLVVGTQNYSSHTDNYVFSNLLSNFFASQFLVGSNVLTAITLNNLVLNYDDPRTIFDGICGLSGFFWGVDPYWEVYYQPPGYNTMPIQLICDNSSAVDFVTRFPAYNFSSEMDYTQPGSIILVIGNGSNVAEVIDPAATSTFQQVQLYGYGNGQIFMRKINDSTLNSANDCVQRGIAELMLYDNPRYIYHLTTNVELKAGQGIPVTSATDGLNQSTLLIQQVQARWMGTDETLHDVWEYQADLGSVNRGATNIMSRLFRKGNQNSSAPLISTTALATIENVGVTDTIDSNSLYAETVLTDSPTAYYRLGEPAGFGITSAYDWGGNAYTGTISGTVTLGQPGALYNDPNTSMLFDGNTGYITLPSATNGNGLSAFSVEVWANLSTASLGGTRQIIASGTTAANTGYQLLWNGVSSLRFIVGNGTSNATASYSVSPVAGAWWHIVGTYDGTNIRLYTNGVLRATTALSGTISASLSPIVGASTGIAAFFPGDLDELAIYPTALASSRILTHYRVGTQANPFTSPSAYATLILAAIPVFYYRLGEPAGTTAIDSSPNALNGVLVGSITRGIPGAIADDTNDATGFSASAAVKAITTDYSYTGISILFWIRLSGDWKFVAITNNGTTTLSYFNGVQGSNDGDPTHDPIYVSQIFDVVGSPASGQLDEVAIFNYVLTPAQIQAFYIAATS